MTFDTFEQKVDRNLVRPVRNFVGKGKDMRPIMQDDMSQLFGGLALGVGRMFLYENRRNW